MTPDRSHSDTVGCVANKVRVEGALPLSTKAPFNPYFYVLKYRSSLRQRFFSSRLFHDFQEFYLSCSSRIRVWMSTFMLTLSHSQFLWSLDMYPWQECKEGVWHLFLLLYFHFGCFPILLAGEWSVQSYYQYVFKVMSVLQFYVAPLYS